MKKVLVLLCMTLLMLNYAVSANANLVQNGDFENGNAYVGSDLTYVTIITVNDQYAIDDNPHNFFTVWADMGDHTTGSGDMLIATPNGYVSPGDRAWYQEVDVSSGTEYVFNGWAAHVTNNDPAILSFQVDGSQIGSLYLLLSKKGQWVPFSFTWTAGSTETVELSIVDFQTTGSGNDFALDDIGFTAIPIPSAVWLLGSGLFGIVGIRRKFSSKFG